MPDKEIRGSQEIGIGDLGIFDPIEEECSMCKGSGVFEPEDFDECPFCEGTGIRIRWKKIRDR